MASTKDILSAQRFNRARLMTAFQSGMPGGRELTPTRPWGGLIGGIVLTVLLFGISWVSTLFAPSLPSGWEHGSLITDENTGARYVSVEGTLHPIRNASSAHLMFPGNLKIVSAGSEALAEATIGAEVGITGAPDQVPSPASVADPSLLTCTATGTAPWTGVNTGEWDEAEDRAVHVTADGQNYLVTGHYRYPIGDDNHSPEQILNNLGLSADTPRTADATWLNVFPEGEPLAALTVPGLGESAGIIPGVEGDVEVGTLLEVSDTANAGTIYVVHRDAAIERLTPVMVQLYAIGDGGIYSTPIPITSRDLSQLQLVSEPLRTTWPADITETIDEEETPCGYLDASAGQVTFVVGNDISTVTARTVDVAPQSGAIIRTRTEANLGYTHLIDESGTMFTLSPAGDTLAALGLDEADDLTVPTQWRDLFTAGPTLSNAEAWATVPQP